MYPTFFQSHTRSRSQYFLRDLSQSYRVLVRVFKYLSVKDLLMASRVCLLWRDLAYSPSLWGTVRLRNVCVRDWHELARFLERRNTRNIDLRKMVFREKQSQENIKNNKEEREELSAPSGEQSVELGEITVSCPSTPSSVSKGLSEREKDTKENESADDTCTSESPRDKNMKGSPWEIKQGASLNASPKMKTQDKTRGTISGSDGQEEDTAEVVPSPDSLTQKSTSETDGVAEIQDMQKFEKDEEKMECDDDEAPAKKRERITKGVQEKDSGEELRTMHCLRSVILPHCEGEVLQMMLTSCKYLTKVCATEFRSASGTAKFDPAYLMEAPDLEELRIGSSRGFCLTTNFNFIKLQKLRVLVMRGLSGTSWPYLGTNLMSLHVGPVKNFSAQTWSNIGSMRNLRALWLEDGGYVNDAIIFDALSRLYKLRRLCLFNFTVGPKLGYALKKIFPLERLFVLPAPSEDGDISTQHGNMLALTETLRHVDEIVWAIRTQDIQSHCEIDHIEMCPTKAKMYSGFTSSDDGSANLWTLQRLETVVKRHLPRTKVRILKLDTTAATRMAMSTL
ncbi:putative F-box domain-containing protein 3 [Homarus americanus]|uniref:Putative F-box domain-containing protein 3 n=1 Tax=Homarus americanus TaxID=6706 RepID=A0A8J5NBF3_HOMAM|nr:putative F-box domain-containing protein 3 [Homarus americanus]